MATIQSPLRTYRKAAKLSLSALAQLFGVNKTTVMRWEAKVPPERVGLIEEKTGVPRWKLRPDLWEAPKEKAH